MPVTIIITGISWVSWLFVGIYGCWVLYHLLQANGSTDAAGQGTEAAVKGFFCFLLVVLVGLNLLPYTGTKITALLFGILLLLMVGYIKTH
ncbi:MAG: hypothetical protein V4671_32330 [Armatimonadota bacterium]